MKKYFSEHFVPSPVHLLRREVVGANCVGVEFGPMKAVFELQVRGDVLSLCAEDLFTIAPQASNVVNLVPRPGYDRESRIEKSMTSDGDKLAANDALEDMHRLASALEQTSTTRKRADRERVAKVLRNLVATVRRGI